MKRLGRSFGKALKQVGITVGGAALVAGVAVLNEPAAGAPLLALGPYGLAALLILQAIGATGLDAFKHRNDAANKGLQPLD